MRYYTGIRLVDLHAQIYLVSTSSLAVDCFEDMSPFAASNFDSPTAAQTEEAGKRAVNGTFARLPAALSCNLETCQPLMEFARLLASQMSFFSIPPMPFMQCADGPALRINEDRGSIAFQLGFPVDVLSTRPVWKFFS